MTSHQNVVSAARGWVGTPYHHLARLKAVGVDCIGLVIGVARELALVPADFDVQGYARSPDGRSLMEISHMHMTRIAREDMQPGDVVVLCFDAEPQHFGIVGDYRHGGHSIIHAASNAGKVIETRLMYSRALQFIAAFKLPGVA